MMLVCYLTNTGVLVVLLAFAIWFIFAIVLMYYLMGDVGGSGVLATIAISGVWGFVLCVSVTVIIMKDIYTGSNQAFKHTDSSVIVTSYDKYEGSFEQAKEFIGAGEGSELIKRDRFGHKFNMDYSPANYYDVPDNEQEWNEVKRVRTNLIDMLMFIQHLHESKSIKADTATERETAE